MKNNKPTTTTTTPITATPTPGFTKIANLLFKRIGAQGALQVAERMGKGMETEPAISGSKTKETSKDAASPFYAKHILS